MLSPRERLVVDILNDMQPYLDEDQMSKLKVQLYIRLQPLEVKEAEANIVPYEETNETLMKYYILAKMSDGLSKRTLRYYKDSLKRFDREVRKPFTACTVMDIQAWLAIVAQRSSKVNADNLRRNVSAFYTWLMDNGIITKNPMRAIKKIKFRKKQVLPFTMEEIEKLRYGAKDIRLRAIIEFLLSTGCRVSEVAGLNRRDVNWKEGECKVLGKGDKERVVFINDAAMLYLEEYLKTRVDHNDALFVSEDKPYERLQVSGIEVIIRNLGKAVGVQNVHPHRFRHTVATWAAKRGMSVQLIQKMLGHENIETTLIYATADMDDLRAAHAKYCT